MAKRVLDSLPRAKGAGRLPPTPRATMTKASTSRFVITSSIRDWIRKTILAWPHPTITWDGVRDAVRKKYPKGEWKRQTLAKYPALQSAFQDTKRRLERERQENKTGKRAKLKAGADEVLQERIAFLERRAREVEEENRQLKERFARWQHNAFAFGMTLQQLDRPLLPIDRGQANE